MNSKIPLNQLAQRIASASATSDDEALKFIKDLFAIIEKEVADGEKVVIEGLGSFAKSHSLTEPITFTPDVEFAEELNEAFALFSPTELNPEVSEDALSSISVEMPEAGSYIEENNAESSTDEIPGSTAEVETANRPAVENISDLNAETKEAQSDAEPTATLPERGENGNESEPAPPQDTLLDESEDALTSEPETITETVVDASLQIALEEEPGEPDVPVIDSSDSSDETEVSVPPVLNSEPEEATSPIAISNSAMKENDEGTVIIKRHGSHFWTGIIIGFILGFAVGVVAFLAYIVAYLKIPVESFIVY